jgi:hypothetical protein
MNVSINEISNSSDTAVKCWLEHNELRRMWKDGAMTIYELQSQNLCGGAGGKAQNPLVRLASLQAKYETQELLNMQQEC